MTAPEFREAYVQHKDTLYRFAYRMTGLAEAAEDLVHDCFLFLLHHPHAHDPRRGTLRSFLIGVIRNLALHWLRREHSFEELDEAALVYRPAEPGEHSRSQLVAHAIATLPPLQREALILAEYEEVPLDEIARIVGAELAAVKSRLHRARENLRRALAPLLDENGAVYGTHG